MRQMLHWLCMVCSAFFIFSAIFSCPISHVTCRFFAQCIMSTNVCGPSCPMVVIQCHGSIAICISSGQCFCTFLAHFPLFNLSIMYLHTFHYIGQKWEAFSAPICVSKCESCHFSSVLLFLLCPAILSCVLMTLDDPCPCTLMISTLFCTFKGLTPYTAKLWRNLAPP